MRLYRVFACIDGEEGEITLDAAEKDLFVCGLRQMLDDGSTGWAQVLDLSGREIEQYSNDPKHIARQARERLRTQGQMDLPFEGVTA